MKAARLRLLVATLLMSAWLGYLGYLALGHAKPVVVSRSQLLYASYFVKADLTFDAGNKPVATIQIRETFGPNRVLAENIDVVNLGEVRLPNNKSLSAGTYFLPLGPAGPKQFRVVSALGNDAQTKLVVYPWTPEVERQVRELVP